MKTMIKFILAFGWFLPTIVVRAQKLPSVQQISLRAPANIKIDGNSAEWANQFQAYNHATEIYYSLANDDDNLYLLIGADQPDIINKILMGGVTLIVDTLSRKVDNGIVITFPTYRLHRLILI